MHIARGTASEWIDPGTQAYMPPEFLGKIKGYKIPGHWKGNIQHYDTFGVGAVWLFPLLNPSTYKFAYLYMDERDKKRGWETNLRALFPVGQFNDDQFQICSEVIKGLLAPTERLSAAMALKKLIGAKL